ncbi:MAG: DNA-directed DNA polymerase I [Acidilobaceae archaeon]
MSSRRLEDGSVRRGKHTLDSYLQAGDNDKLKLQTGLRGETEEAKKSEDPHSVAGLLESIREELSGSGRKLEIEKPQRQDVSTKEKKTLREPYNLVKEASGYVLDIRYDGRLGKAVLLILTDSGELVRWVDRTDHKPYFLTDASPEELASIGLDSETNSLVSQFDLVSKFHPIRRETVKLTKVIVRDPLAVRKLREKVKNKRFQVWEADIRYHNNYVFDNLIVPGARHNAGKTVARVQAFRELASRATVLEKAKRYLSNARISADPQLVEEWISMFLEEPPNVLRVALDVEVYAPAEGRVPDPNRALYPVISVALADSEGRRKVLLLYREGATFEGALPKDAIVEVYDSEKALILALFEELERYPVILTYNGDNFDLVYLYNRLLMLGIEPNSIPLEFHEDKVTFRHAIHIDLHKLFNIKALKSYAFGNRYREQTLDAIAGALLGESKVKLEDLISKVSLDKLVEYNLRDAELTLKLTTYSSNLVWNLIILLARITKLGLEDLTRHQVSTWIRSLMNWEHRKRGWLIPEKSEIAGFSEARSKAIIKEKKYRGAIVLEPPAGAFFNVLVLDFASLYPSIIRNWNLSYETVNNPYCKKYREVPEVEHKVCIDFTGITSELVGLMRDLRVHLFKKLSKDSELSPEQRAWYDVVQAALKVLINASYGVFGNEQFPFFSLSLAESVTAIGRTVMLDTLRKAEELGLIILYGDTDSLFLWTSDMNSLKKLVSYVEEKYGLDLEVDKFFKLVLFSGLKKNYIGVAENREVVIKGMVVKKSNTPEFIKKEFAEVVEILKSVDNTESLVKAVDLISEKVKEIYKRIKNKGYTLDELAIKVMLTKDLDEYKKTTPQHVKAAKLLLLENLNVSRGDIISFVKTRDSIGVKPVQLAKLSDIDPSKYIEHAKTALEQVLLSLGLTWEEIIGYKSLSKLLAETKMDEDRLRNEAS